MSRTGAPFIWIRVPNYVDWEFNTNANLVTLVACFWLPIAIVTAFRLGCAPIDIWDISPSTTYRLILGFLSRIGMLTCSGGKLDLETAELSCFYLCRTSTVLYDNKLNIRESPLCLFSMIFPPSASAPFIDISVAGYAPMRQYNLRSSTMTKPCACRSAA